MRLSGIFRTATFRLAALYLVIFAVSVGCLFGVIFYVMRNALQEELRARVLDEINYLTHEYKEDGLSELIEEIEEKIEKAQGGDRLSYFLKNEDGQIIFDPTDQLPERSGWSVDFEKSLMIYVVPLEKNYVLAVGGSLAQIKSVEKVMLKYLVGTLLGVLIAGGFGGYLLSKRVMAQIGQIAFTAKKIGGGALSERIPVNQNRDEVDALAETLNGMFDQIEGLMNNTRNAAINIAHDLRTPLSRIRQKIEQMSQSLPNEREALNDLVGEVDNVLKTFSAILNISEVETGQARAKFISVNLSEVTEHIADTYAPLISDKNGKFVKNIQPDIVINADKQLIQQLLSNLLDNAILHSTAELNIEVSLSRDKDIIILVVADHGPGISAKYHDDVFKPFFRIDSPSKPAGSGLGLSLVAAICNLHGVKISLEDNQPGLRVSMKFPGRPDR